MRRPTTTRDRLARWTLAAIAAGWFAAISTTIVNGRRRAARQEAVGLASDVGLVLNYRPLPWTTSTAAWLRWRLTPRQWRTWPCPKMHRPVPATIRTASAARPLDADGVDVLSSLPPARVLYLKDAGLGGRDVLTALRAHAAALQAVDLRGNEVTADVRDWCREHGVRRLP